MQQLLLFDLNDFDIHLNYAKANVVKTSPLEWRFAEIEGLPKKYLEAICMRFKLPYSGTKKRLLERLKNYVKLWELARDNTDNFVVKEKPPYTVKQIKTILDSMRIKHSWLKKREKLELAVKKIRESWLHRSTK